MVTMAVNKANSESNERGFAFTVTNFSKVPHTGDIKGVRVAEDLDVLKTMVGFTCMRAFSHSC
jgi:hypothetical protein